MKRKVLFIITTLFVITLTFTGIFSSKSYVISINEVKSEMDNSEYILTPIICRQFFGYEVSELKQRLTDSNIINGQFQSIEILENGNVKIILSKEDIEYWKTQLCGAIDDVINNGKVYNCYYSVSDDYTKIVSKVTKENYFDSGLGVLKLVPYCSIIQMLDGTEPSDCNVYFEFIRLEDDKFVKSGVLPKDGKFSFDESDIE